MEYLKSLKGRSAVDFINYLCYQCCPENKNFNTHCQSLYTEQKGSCAITGMRMFFSDYEQNPLHICINCIDVSRGYVIGNVRLVMFVINQMRILLTNDEEIYVLAEAIIRRRDDSNIEQKK